MSKFNKYFVSLSAIALLAALIMGNAYAWRPFWKRGRHRPKPIVIKPKPKIVAPAKKYIIAHDLNNDGRVDVKDRLMWIRQNKNGYVPIHISDDNRNLLEEIDANKNGEVEPKEIQRYYLKYDLNKNGILEDSEIRASLD